MCTASPMGTLAMGHAGHAVAFWALLNSYAACARVRPTNQRWLPMRRLGTLATCTQQHESPAQSTTL
eukprot:366522-Chlamydomonas_euryale.AAC.21